MIPPESRSHLNDDAAIDRLVDGELSEHERRELLLALENDPEGWRRCALAFLQDQAWRTALGGLPASIAKTETPSVATNVRRSKKLWIRQVSIAASILGATFALGFSAGGISRGTPNVQTARSDPPKSADPLIPPPAEPYHEVGWIDVVDGSNGESPSQRVPILSGPVIDEQTLREQPPSVPDYVRAQWERQGYQIEERRKLVSVTLKDGRRVSIPVDEVALDYVGQRPL